MANASSLFPFSSSSSLLNDYEINAVVFSLIGEIHHNNLFGRRNVNHRRRRRQRRSRSVENWRKQRREGTAEVRGHHRNGYCVESTNNSHAHEVPCIHHHVQVNLNQTKVNLLRPKVMIYLFGIDSILRLWLSL